MNPLELRADPSPTIPPRRTPRAGALARGGLAILAATAACGVDPSGSDPARAGGPRFPGAGSDHHPMPSGAVLRCYYDPADPGMPAATIEHVLEVFTGASAVHLRLTLDPRFVDNTYGTSAIGWGRRGHTYKDLDGSDRAQLLLYDAAGALAMDLSMDYITRMVTLGVEGGEGEVSRGDPRHVLAVDTSLSQNFNARGYTAYAVDSPATDAAYTPDPAAPGWDYRVVYEVWVDVAAFGAAGFGRGEVEYIHASPSKLDDNTVTVEPDPCPPDWVPPAGCDDPDGCPGGGGCRSDNDCGSGQVCIGEGTCVPRID